MHLRDDELIDVEELGETLLGQVRLHTRGRAEIAPRSSWDGSGLGVGLRSEARSQRGVRRACMRAAPHLQPAVRPRPAARLEVGLDAAIAPFGLELDGIEDAGDGARSERRAVHEHVRRREVIAQQRWRFAVGARHL